jgi:ribosomal subunit interface protein
MQTPLQLTFRGMPHSDALALHIEGRAAKLEELFDRIISCHVVVKQAGHHHRHGDRFELSINLGLPGHELLVNHAAAEDRGAENAYASADRSFDEAERQLEDWVRRLRDQRRVPAPSDSARDT